MCRKKVKRKINAVLFDTWKCSEKEVTGRTIQIIKGKATFHRLLPIFQKE